MPIILPKLDVERFGSNSKRLNKHFNMSRRHTQT